VALGCRNGAELWRRLRARGFSGSLRVVTEWATRCRRDEVAGAPRRRPRKPRSPPREAALRRITVCTKHASEPRLHADPHLPAGPIQYAPFFHIRTDCHLEWIALDRSAYAIGRGLSDISRKFRL
jgi:hypothetical protein